MSAVEGEAKEKADESNEKVCCEEVSNAKEEVGEKKKKDEVSDESELAAEEKNSKPDDAAAEAVGLS